MLICTAHENSKTVTQIYGFAALAIQFQGKIHAKEKGNIVTEFMDTTLLFVDERSMTDFQTLGRAECGVTRSTRDRKFSKRYWGNLSVVVLIGDDLQLQSVQKGTLYRPVGPHECRAKLKLT